ncbi:MAG: 3-hydroxyacyl-CoA dehydrogenase NAD-binding domain-containing protein, partial [Nitrososphaerales archaeon]
MVSEGLKPIPEKVAIIGFGLMGAQVAQVFAQSGYSVSCYDLNREQISRGLDLILNGRYGLKRSVERGRLSKEEAGLALARITTHESIEETASGAEIVLEAAIEELETKRRIMQKASFVT